MEEIQNSQLKVLEQVRLGAIRWMHSIDLNRCSSTYGVADRDYWSWKTKDFANGTWQGGLAGFLDSSELVGVTHPQIRELVRATLKGTLTIQRSNGSFEEAYPYESSYAVTGLVLFNLLYSRYRYPTFFSREEEALLNTITLKSADFLERTPETHGLISNHLATSGLALFLASKFLSRRPSPSWDNFMRLQNEEGWFPEYGGADPGYQTLLNHYVVASAKAHSLPSAFEKAISQSQTFLEHFCFPDGSFAGEIGSRGTSIVYPAGLWDLNYRSTALSTWFLKRHAPYLGAVTPSSADGGNFVPVFNSWALAQQLAKGPDEGNEPLYFPPQTKKWQLPEAKFMGVQTPRAFLVLSLHNGAIRKCVRDDNKFRDESVVAFHSSKEKTAYVAVPLSFKISESQLQYTLGLVESPNLLNNAWRSSLIRMIGLLIYPFPRAQRVFKNVLSYLVMKRQDIHPKTTVDVKVDLRDDLPIQLEVHEPSTHFLNFGFNRHMASANTFDPRAL